METETGGAYKVEQLGVWQREFQDSQDCTLKNVLSVDIEYVNYKMYNMDEPPQDQT